MDFNVLFHRATKKVWSVAKEKKKTIVLIVILLSLSIYIRSKLLELLKDKLQREQCKSVSTNDTIFISYVTIRPYEAEKTIRHLFNNTFCLKRIHIALLEYIEPQIYNQPIHPGQHLDRMFLKNIHHATENLLGKSFLNKYRSQITVHTKHIQESRGQAHGRAYIEQRMYGGQEYFMMIEDGVRLPKNWDLDLVDQMKELNNPWIIFTQPTKEKIWNWGVGEKLFGILNRSKATSRSRKSKRGELLEHEERKGPETVGQWSCIEEQQIDFGQVEYTKMKNKNQPIDPQWLPRNVFGPTFTTVQHKYQRHPYFKYLPNIKTFSTNSIWCAQFSFMNSFVIRRCPHLMDMPYLDAGYDWFMSIRYWTNGFDFVIPKQFSIERKPIVGMDRFQTVFLNQSKLLETYSKFYSAPSENTPRTPQQYYQWLGIGVANGDYSSLGVPTLTNGSDIVSKFGSMHIFSQFMN